MENKKVLLSIKDLEVKFHVRGRILTAIRGISLDIYENESIAIVGESASGKSVFTKTFAGMLDSNGFISNGKILFDDRELGDTTLVLNDKYKAQIERSFEMLNAASKLTFGVETFKKMEALKAEKLAKAQLSEDRREELQEAIDNANFESTQAYNESLAYKKLDKAKHKELIDKSKQLKAEADKLVKQLADEEKQVKLAAAADSAYLTDFENKLAQLGKKYAEEINVEISEETKQRNLKLAKEIVLSTGRYPFYKRKKLIKQIHSSLYKALQEGLDLNDDDVKDDCFKNATFRVNLEDETEEKLHGNVVSDLAQIKYDKDWSLIRGTRIATVFQDPMTSLNPVLTIGEQITSVILKHQNVTELEARQKAIELMNKVGIPNAENRFDDYPYQYSGGMRQRIVIAIALSCQPKILICDEPTTALDVTIQAQILKLIKDLQKEFNYTIVFITHDLGVVANIADRVAVLYAGQIVELGTVDEIFYQPAHPYTWALLSSLPQLAERNTKLFTIAGTPPSLYNVIKGDAFAPRNAYALRIDTIEKPPVFKISETHYARTWLLDPRAPKIEKPEIIQNIHEKLIKAFNI